MKSNLTLLALFLWVVMIITPACSKKDSETSITCHITVPKTGDSITIGNLVTISADINKSGANIDEVRFFIDNVGISSATVFPYSSQWNTTGESAGIHSIRVTVFDFSQKTASDEITVYLTEAIMSLDTTNVSTGPVLVVTDSSAAIKGFADDKEGVPVTDRGICAAFTHNPDTASSIKVSDGSGAGTFYVSLVNLDPDTLYYARTWAVYGSDIVYGNEISFHTAVRTITDFDGNVYKVVKIGSQEWMAENLKVTHFRTGEEIPHIDENLSWNSMSAAYCYYENQPINLDVYGAIYNYYAVSDQRNICPEGWHIPTTDDWKLLVEFLDGKDNAGGKMKVAGTDYWLSENTGGDNSSGFTALPGGYRSPSGAFNNLGTLGAWWSSDTGLSNPSENASYLFIYNNSPFAVIEELPKLYGLSVRCIKDR